MNVILMSVYVVCMPLAQKKNWREEIGTNAEKDHSSYRPYVRDFTFWGRFVRTH